MSYCYQYHYYLVCLSLILSADNSAGFPFSFDNNAKLVFFFIYQKDDVMSRGLFLKICRPRLTSVCHPFPESTILFKRAETVVKLIHI